MATGRAHHLVTPGQRARAKRFHPISRFSPSLPRGRFLLAAVSLALSLILLSSGTPLALEPIVIGAEQEQIEISLQGEIYEGRGDQLQVETAAGADGIAGRMSVRAATSGTNPNWMVFALNNPTNRRMVRWFTADRYSIVGSGVYWPSLDSRHIVRVTPSLGFRPERIENDSADIFRIELEPGATVTFIAELTSDRIPRMFLWQAQAFEKQLRDLTLFNGILLGITGLLAVFLTAIFVANHKAIFPSIALISWSVVAYLCVDFGFWHKIFQLNPENNAIYRAGSEAAIALSLVVFLFTFLRLSLWHGWIRALFAGWFLAQLALIGLALLDARLASGLARGSFVVIGGFGTLLIVYLALRGQDRALALVPSWLLLLVWIFGATMSVFGQISGDIVVAGLISGLVLIVVLQAFTATQFAFGSFEPLYGAPPSQLQGRSLAIDGAGAAVWEWSARRDEITVSNEIEVALGLAQGTLNCRVDEWLKYLHPADRERFRMLLWTVHERNGGELNLDFRMRRSDSSLLWFELRAHSVPTNQYRSLKCVGLIRDVTDARRAQERLLRDAVHDSLTSLPNRALFLDRLENAITRATEEAANRPTVLFIDIDRFKNVNTSFGLVVGDSMLLTLARRLARHLSPLDTLARIGGDQFAIMLVTETEPRQIAMIAERVRRSLRSPMKIAGKEIILTGSIGIAVYDGKQASHQDVLREAEVAMYRAKRSGNDRVEIFKPSMRDEKDDRVQLESDLRRAIDRRQIRVLYQPIMRLENEQLAGFEALLRWEHPRLGTLNPADFVPIAEETGFISELGSFVLDRASRQAARWQKALPDAENPLFVSINISSRQLFRHDLIQDIRHILKRDAVPKGCVKLEVTESLVMENPEQAAEILEWLKGAGAGLSLDDFGTGYSSFSYLHRFPFDTIKVDKSLVQHAGMNGSGSVIVRSIIALAHELGMDVVAEGVETPEDAKFLRSLHCEYAQGSYYGEPMTEKNVFALLSAIAKSSARNGKGRAVDMFRRKQKTSPLEPNEMISDAANAPERPENNGSVPKSENLRKGKSRVPVD